MPRSCALYTRLFLLLALSACSCILAQTAQPITSLPKPQGDDSSVSMQQEQAPDTSARPITSLPKPPQSDTGASSTTPAPAETTPPVEAPQAASPEAAPAPVAAMPPNTTVAPENVPSTPTTAPPQPAPTLDKPLVAHIQPAETTQPVVVRRKRIHAFSTFGVAFKVGAAGIGIDIATPLAQHFNLRGGGNIFSYTGTYNDSGDVFSGTAQLRSGSFYLDYFPFHNGFRMSAGAVINGTQLNGTTSVAPGTEFDLGDGTYYSSTTDPVHGTVAFNFGRKVAPSFTIGFGNIIPRSGKHISFPFEVGFDYAGAPTIALTLVGTVCDTSTPPNCQKIDSDPTAQADLLQQQNDINSDIRFLRFYPILSQGISFSF
jgi:hypothetical protein